MVSEQDFYLLNGNQYRGSRYSNFAGAGVDPQGNVSSAVNENSANQSAGTSVDPTQTGGTEQPVGTAVDSAVSRKINTKTGTPAAPTSLGGTVTNMALGAAIPAATSTIGGVVGANLASGNPALAGAGSAVKNRISSGLLSTGGSAATATNAALGSMGGSFGPAPASAVTKAAGGSAIGSAAGTGFGAAAATLLGGGSLKDAAVSGVGSAAGFYIGNMILPGIGGFIGSTLGGMVGNLFGGGGGRQSISALLTADQDGKYQVASTTNKGSDSGTASKYGEQVAKILDTFSTATGIKYSPTDSFYAGSNIGKKDPGSYYNDGADHVVSGTPGDAGAVALAALKNPGRYTLGDDTQFNDFWKTSVNEAGSINDLGDRVDNFFASRNLTAKPKLSKAAIATKVNNTRRFGDRAMSFYG